MPKTSTSRRELQGTVAKLFYRRDEAAFALGVSTRSIDAMIADRRLTTRRFGRAVLIPAADVARVAETILRSDMLEGVGAGKSDPPRPRLVS